MGELEKTLNEQISRKRHNKKKNTLNNLTLDNEDILKLLENEDPHQPDANNNQT
jgi:hypothetical protein